MPCHGRPGTRAEPRDWGAPGVPGTLRPGDLQEDEVPRGRGKLQLTSHSASVPRAGRALGSACLAHAGPPAGLTRVRGQGRAHRAPLG